jgi:hypothetical protein
MKIVYFQAYKNKNQGFLAERYDFFFPIFAVITPYHPV